MSTTVPISTIAARVGRSARLLGIIGAAAGLLWVAMVIWEYQANLQPSDGPLTGSRLVNQIGFAVVIAGYVALLVGVHRARPAGPGRLARVFTGLFVTAWLFVFAGQLVNLLANVSEDDNFLPAIGGLLQVVAALGTGISVARRGHWTGWRRWWPLALSVYYVGVMFVPLFAGREPNMITETGWGLTYAVLGIALATAAHREPASAPA